MFDFFFEIKYLKTMKTLKVYLLILSLFTIFLKSNAADNTYYIWAGATKVNDEVNLLQSDNWSVSNTEYIAPPEGTQINSPTSNWVFDYEAYLPISGRADNIFYRFQEAMINVGSITIVNHNASDTGYWTNGNTIEPTGASTGIKFVSGKGNSSWNIGTFTYTGAAGSYDRGVILGAGQVTSFQPDIFIETMNIGYGENTTQLRIGDYASGVAYATIDSSENKVGDAIEISDTTGPKSLTVTGNFNIHGNSTVSMNVYNDDPMAIHSESIPEVLIEGIIYMTKSEGGKTPILNLLNRTTTISWRPTLPAVPATNTFIKIGGLQGEGKISNESKTLDASTVKLIFTNKTDCEFKGEFTENRTDSIKTIMSVKMAGLDGKKQIINADSKFTGTVEVESGTLIIGSTSSLGKLTMTGGEFGSISGGVIVSEAEWQEGDFIYYNKDALSSGVPDKITIEGTFYKSGDGVIGIDFDGFDASVFVSDGTKLELITAGILDGFSDNANDDFLAKNLLNALAEFEWDGNTLLVSFVNVPEPATFAAIFCVSTLLFAMRFRRK